MEHWFNGAYTQIVVTEDTQASFIINVQVVYYMGNYAVVIGSTRSIMLKLIIDMRNVVNGGWELTPAITSGISSGNVATFTSGAVDNGL